MRGMYPLPPLPLITPPPPLTLPPPALCCEFDEVLSWYPSASSSGMISRSPDSLDNESALMLGLMLSIEEEPSLQFCSVLDVVGEFVEVEAQELFCTTLLLTPLELKFSPIALLTGVDWLTASRPSSSSLQPSPPKSTPLPVGFLLLAAIPSGGQPEPPDSKDSVAIGDVGIMASEFECIKSVECESVVEGIQSSMTDVGKWPLTCVEVEPTWMTFMFCWFDEDVAMIESTSDDVWCDIVDVGDASASNSCERSWSADSPSPL